MKKVTSDEMLAEWFAHHPPTSASIIAAHEQIRASFLKLAREMNDLLPEGPDKTVALRAIRDAAMQANGCVAVAQKVFIAELKCLICGEAVEEVSGGLYQHSVMPDVSHPISL